MTIDENLIALKNLISTIPEIKETVTYLKSLKSTPQAVVLYRGTNEDVVSTRNVKLDHTFNLLIRQDFKNSAKQEENLRLLTDIVVEKINSNRNLGGLIEFINIENISIEGEEIEEKVRTINIVLNLQNFNEIL